MQVADALVRDQIDYKRAALLLYCLQIASANLRHVRFEPLHADDVVRDEPASALANDQRLTTNDHVADDRGTDDSPSARLTDSRR